MASLRDLRRRTRSVKNTQQITKAMKMVAAAKLRRAQDAILSARPFAKKMLEVLNSLATRADPESHPLLRAREPNHVDVVVITADKGLCGSFNANILKSAEQFLRGITCERLELQVVGKKARDYFRRRRSIRQEYPDVFRELSYETAGSIARPLIERYSKDDPDAEDRVDAVFLIYNEFKSVMQQDVVVERLLPLEKLHFENVAEELDYIYEPTAAEIYDAIIPRHVEYQVWHALLESAAAEHAARMTAMENATRNATELIEKLTLTMNKVRQASITTEILEVVSGAEAIR
ncbi:MAG TPA: ATP synthase F1 subunit gamma [Vicinamibacteria bacterium]|nr:ATP synthase F1 subunit gamma [Vicinamibacteria bacterium]